MTINQEAVEQMALRLTSAVDAMHTFAEAVRLATASLQETREVPEVKPGMVGTATVRGERDVKVFRVKRLDTSPLELWVSERLVAGCIQHRDHLVTSFVPDPDTAALRAEVERLDGELESERHAVETQSGLYEGLAKWAKEQRARADAAEARLARVTEHSIVCAVIERHPSFDTLSARGIAQTVLALVATDEQAAEVVRVPVADFVQQAILSDKKRRAGSDCTCKTSNSACREGCTHERVIDRTCPVHGEKAEAEAPVAPPQERIAEALKTAYTHIHNQDPRRKYAVSEVKQIVYPLISLLEEFGFHEVEVSDG